MKAASSGTSLAGLLRPFLIAPLLYSALLLTGCTRRNASPGEDDFVRLMNIGQALYDKGDATKAVETFEKAVALAPTHPDARLNLANAYLLAGQASDAIREAQEILKLEPNSAAAYYFQGCDYMRRGHFDEAIKSFQ